MSTLTRFNRAGRQERRDMELRFRSLAMTITDQTMAWVYFAASDALKKLRLDPRSDGARKQRVYEQVCAEVELNELKVQERANAPHTEPAVGETVTDQKMTTIFGDQNRDGTPVENETAPDTH